MNQKVYCDVYNLNICFVKGLFQIVADNCLTLNIDNGIFEKKRR